MIFVVFLISVKSLQRCLSVLFSSLKHGSRQIEGGAPVSPANPLLPAWFYSPFIYFSQPGFGEISLTKARRS